MVYVIDSMDKFCEFKRKTYNSIGLELPKYLDNDIVYSHDPAIHFADKVIVFNSPNSSLVKNIMKLKSVKKHKSKISVIDLDDIESPDYFTISDQLNEVITS